MPAVAAIGLGMIALHNALDPIRPEAFGRWAPLWGVLHVSGGYEMPGFRLGVGYPLIPWIGVMAAGYSLGTIYRWAPEGRRKLLWRFLFGGPAR